VERGLKMKLSLSECGKYLFHKLFEIFRANEYLELLEKENKHLKSSWSKPFLYIGFLFAMISSMVVLIFEPLSNMVAIYLVDPQKKPTSRIIAATIFSLHIIKSLALIIFSIASGMCLSALIDVSIKLSYFMHERELEKSLKSMLGIDCKNFSEELAVVIGEVIINPTNLNTNQQVNEQGCKDINIPNWKITPKELVSGVANDIINLHHSNVTVTIIEDLKAVSKISMILSQAGAGSPKLMTATEAMREIELNNKSVKCFVTIGLFSNIFSLEHISNQQKNGLKKPLVRLTRNSRIQLSASSDSCIASFHSKKMDKDEIYHVNFDSNGNIVDSSNQLNGSDLGLISRIALFDKDGVKTHSIVCIGGFGPSGTTGAVEAFKQIIDGTLHDPTLDKLPNQDDYVAVFRASLQNPMQIEHYRTYL